MQIKQTCLCRLNKHQSKVFIWAYRNLLCCVNGSEPRCSTYVTSTIKYNKNRSDPTFIIMDLAKLSTRRQRLFPRSIMNVHAQLSISLPVNVACIAVIRGRSQSFKPHRLHQRRMTGYAMGKNIRRRKGKGKKWWLRRCKAWGGNHERETQTDKRKRDTGAMKQADMLGCLPVDCGSQWCSSAEPVLSSVFTLMS